MRLKGAAQEEVLFRSQPAMRPQYASGTTKEASPASQTTSGYEPTFEKTGSQSSYTRTQIAVTFVVLAVLVQVVAHSKDVNIATMLGVTGGIAAIALVFVAPAACCAKFAIASASNDRSNATRWLLWLSIALGVVAAIACVVSEIASKANG